MTSDEQQPTSPAPGFAPPSDPFAPPSDLFAAPSSVRAASGPVVFGAAPAPAAASVVGHVGPRAVAAVQAGAPGPEPFPYATAVRERLDGSGRPRRRRVVGVAWLLPLVVVAAAAGAGGGVLADRLIRPDHHLADAGLPAPVVTTAPQHDPGSVAGLAATVLPSVVSIQVSSSAGVSTGSGLVLRADGYILTNNHVIADSATSGAAIEVLFGDGTQEEATLVGRTADYDLAVVKVERGDLTPLVLGDSDIVVVGDPVIAIGAPLGLQGTVTTGIVSALNRPVTAGDTGDTAFINAIQTDAAINPGNSGGPLINASGEVVGINSAIAQPPGTLGGASGSIGLGFAIPSNQARRTAEQLIETGHATYPVVGVLLDQTYTGEGVRVATEGRGGQLPVSAGGPADRAGIAAGDVILSIDGRPVTEPDELIVAIRAKAPGDTVVLKVRSGGGAADERELRLVLQEATSG